MHPLRQAYLCALKDEYGVVLYGDKNPTRTKLVADDVSVLGIRYEAYIKIAFSLLEGVVSSIGRDAYPYWNMVISDKTIIRVAKLLRDTADNVLDVNDAPNMFELELQHAMHYIRWYLGLEDGKPRRYFNKDDSTVGDVAEYVCRVHGVTFITSNYNILAKALEGKIE